MMYRKRSRVTSKFFFARSGTGSAMHVAAGGGHHVVVQHFLTRGMNINLQDDCGCSALHVAAQHGIT